MKNFTKTLAAAAIITIASGTESAFAHRLTSDAAELKSNEIAASVSQERGLFDFLFPTKPVIPVTPNFPTKPVIKGNATDDTAMFRYIADKSFDVEIHKTEASDIAISMPHFIVDKSFDVEIHKTEASDKA